MIEVKGKGRLFRLVGNLQPAPRRWDKGQGFIGHLKCLLLIPTRVDPGDLTCDCCDFGGSGFNNSVSRRTVVHRLCWSLRRNDQRSFSVRVRLTRD